MTTAVTIAQFAAGAPRDALPAKRRTTERQELRCCTVLPNMGDFVMSLVTSLFPNRSVV